MFVVLVRGVVAYRRVFRRTAHGVAYPLGHKCLGLSSSKSVSMLCSLHSSVSPRFRSIDRMFVNPQAKGLARSFALLGTERMAPPHSCFPSDHFGLDACFEL